MRYLAAFVLICSAADAGLSLLRHQEDALWGARILVVGNAMGYAVARLLDYMRQPPK